MDNRSVYIGWDSREGVAYSVCRHSVVRRSKKEPTIVPLKHRELRKQGLFRRPWLVDSETGGWTDLIDNKPFSTEFSHTRFLVPALHKKGWALFCDADMLFNCDIEEVFKHIDDRYAVMVVPHRHQPKLNKKMDDRPQALYDRKNWSSFILFNCDHPANRSLTPEIVSTKSGSWLHGFNWLKDSQIGFLPFDFNWIDGSSPVLSTLPKVIHYTYGGPWFQGLSDVKFAENWIEEYEHWQREGDHSEFVDVPTTKYD